MGHAKTLRRERRAERREAKAARKKLAREKRARAPGASACAPDGLFDDCPICLAIRAGDPCGPFTRVDLPAELLAELGLDVVVSAPGALRSRGAS